MLPVVGIVAGIVQPVTLRIIVALEALTKAVPVVVVVLAIYVLDHLAVCTREKLLGLPRGFSVE